MNLREVVERVWRARKSILLFELIAILLTVFVIVFWPRTYASNAKIFLQRGRESVGLDPTANATGQTIALQQAGRDAEINSALDVLRSRGILEPVVDKLTPEVVKGDVVIGEVRETSKVSSAIKAGFGWTLDQIRQIDPSSYRERAVIELERNLSVDSERKSEIISLSYEADSPELAQLVVAAIVEEYRDKHSELHRTQGSMAFFDEQMCRLREEFKNRSMRLRDAKNRMGLATIDGRRKNLEEGQLGEIRLDLLKTDKALFGARATAKNLAQQLVERPERLSSEETTKPNNAADLQSQLLYALQIELLDAKAKFKSTHPTVMKLENQVAEAKIVHSDQTISRKESTQDINPVHERLTMDFTAAEAEIAGLEAAKKRLLGQEAELLDEIKLLNSFEVELAELKLNVDVSQEKYQTYAENYESARVDQAMQKDITSISDAQPATFQEKPVSPSKPLIAICGALLCLLGPVLIALARVKTDDTLISKHAIQKSLKLPVLGVLPDSKALARVGIH